MAEAAYNRRDIKSLQSISDTILQLLLDRDELLGSHASFLLGRWIAGARSWGKDREEQDLFEFNARNQVTLWGNEGNIKEYAAKDWSGLVRGYHYHRWELFFSMCLSAIAKGDAGLDLDLYGQEELKIGQRFSNETHPVFPVDPTGDTAEISYRMMSRYGSNYKSKFGYTVFINTDGQGSNNDGNLLETPMWTTNIPQLQKLCDSDEKCVGFSSNGLLKSDVAVKVTSTSKSDLYIKTASNI